MSPNCTDNGTPNCRIDQKTSGPLKRGAFRALVQDFSPIWFTWCMNSGIIAILLHQHPYRFNGINTLACIFFGFDFLFFILFSCAFILRIIWFPKQTFKEITGDIGQLALLACWPIAWMTLADLVALLVSTAYWGRFWATVAAYVMWCFSLAWTLATLMFVFVILVRRAMLGKGEGEAVTRLPPLIIIPAVAVTTQALSAGIIVTYGYGATARMAVPIIIIGFVICGIGIIMGLILLTMLWYALLVDGFPAPAQTSALFVFIGPMGQGASALLALGSAAQQTNFFAEYNRGTFITASSAPVLSTMCTLLALLLLGMAVFLFFVGLYAMIERLVLRKLSWNMTWNSIIFPSGTMATATTLLSTQLASPAFSVLASIQLIFLVIIFLVNLTMTTLQVGKGQLLVVREDSRVRKELAEIEKEK